MIDYPPATRGRAQRRYVRTIADNLTRATLASIPAPRSSAPARLTDAPPVPLALR